MSEDTSDEELEEGAQFVLVDDLDLLSVALATLGEMEVQAIAVDAEGTNLSRQGKLCIMQIGLPRSVPVAEQVYIIDILALGKQAFDYEEEGLSLRGVLQDTEVTKWMCDCRRDSDALYHQFGIHLQNVVDLQLAEVATRRLTGDPAPRVLGLRGILDRYLPVRELKEMLPYCTKTEAIKQAFDADPTSWERRPLTADQVMYAATDVAFMCRLAEIIYDVLPDEIRARVDGVSKQRVQWYSETDDTALSDTSDRAIAPLF